jgi:hypothetical protein
MFTLLIVYVWVTILQRVVIPWGVSRLVRGGGSTRPSTLEKIAKVTVWVCFHHHMGPAFHHGSDIFSLPYSEERTLGYQNREVVKRWTTAPVSWKYIVTTAN